METANVQQFRTQWDPIFENAQIPFYTVAGDICTEPKPSAACTNTVTGPILQAHHRRGKLPPNDGLVTEPETYLPTTYAMNLGVESNDHYQLRLGDNLFLHDLLARDGAGEPAERTTGLTRVATNGFGDQANSEAWSMAWFNGQVVRRDGPGSVLCHQPPTRPF